MKTLKEMIEIMQAFAQGENIYVKDLTIPDDKYTLVDEPRWNWERYDYITQIELLKEFKFEIGDILISKGDCNGKSIKENSLIKIGDIQKSYRTELGEAYSKNFIERYYVKLDDCLCFYEFQFKVPTKDHYISHYRLTKEEAEDYAEKFDVRNFGPRLEMGARLPNDMK